MRTPYFSTLLCFLFVSVLLAVGCKKDDDDGGVSNSFTINGQTYALTKGFIVEFGVNGNGSFDWDVTLTSDGINYSEALQQFNGVGDAIYLDLNTSSETGLVNGTYSFSSERNAFTLVDGQVFIDFDLGAFTGEDYSVIGGTVDVEVMGNETSIIFNLTVSNNTTVTGSFRGVLRPV